MHDDFSACVWSNRHIACYFYNYCDFLIYLLSLIIKKNIRCVDRELLIPVADSVDDDASSKPSSSASSSHHSGREVTLVSLSLSCVLIDCLIDAVWIHETVKGFGYFGYLYLCCLSVRSIANLLSCFWVLWSDCIDVWLFLVI